MIVTIRGISEPLKSRIYRYVSRMCESLSVDMNLNTDLDVCFVPNVKGDGYCIGDMNGIEVIIKRQSVPTMMLTLAHEMVHVSQILYNREVSEHEAYDMESSLVQLFDSD